MKHATHLQVYIGQLLRCARLRSTHLQPTHTQPTHTQPTVRSTLASSCAVLASLLKQHNLTCSTHTHRIMNHATHLQVYVGQLLRCARLSVYAKLIRQAIRTFGRGRHQLQAMRHVVVANHTVCVNRVYVSARTRWFWCVYFVAFSEAGTSFKRCAMWL